MTCRKRKRTEGFTAESRCWSRFTVVRSRSPAIGRGSAVTIRGARSVGGHLALTETARAIMTGLADRRSAEAGQLLGETASHRWRVDVRRSTRTSSTREAEWNNQQTVVVPGAVADRDGPAAQHGAPCAAPEAQP